MSQDNILQILKNSQYTVVLSGAELMTECGYPPLRDGEEAYDIEIEYGYSFEEIYSSAFYSTRKERFFRFYKEKMLKTVKNVPPSEAYYNLKKLQDHGLVQSIITRQVTALERRAGCSNVIMLKGTMEENICPGCGQHYSMEYMLEAKDVPLCPKCQVAIRPRICLIGEMIDNGVMTRAVEEVSKADVLLVLGANLSSPLCKYMLQYYKGSHVIVVEENAHYSDELADIVVHGRSDEFLNSFAATL